MRNRKLKVGLIGCGRFAIPGHAVYYTMNSRADFCAVCDVNEEAARKVARYFNVKNVYSDYMTMLDEAGLDAVSICTPTFSHREIAVAAADRGINVLCEKPFAPNIDDGRAIVDACRDNGVVLHVGFHKRYDRGIEKARQLIEDEKYGRCFHAEFRWNGLSTFGTVPVVNNTLSIMQKFGYSMENYSPDWRLSDPRIPGGVLEVFCHIVDLALWFFGPPDMLEGNAFKVSADANKPEHTAIILKYNRGLSVFLTMSNKALSLSEKESGLFNCSDGNLYYTTNSTKQTFTPATLSLETGDWFFGRKRTLPPALAANPIDNLPLYRRINCFLLDILEELPDDSVETIPRGEDGVAVDTIIQEIVKKS